MPAPVVGDIDQFLREVVSQLAPEFDRRPGPGHLRVLPALVLWAGLLVCVLEGCGSQLTLWRRLSQTGLWDYPRVPVSDQAVYHRLERRSSNQAAS